MNFGSVCSGIEAASCAWEPLGWCCSFAAEIEWFPSAVLKERWPNTPNLGDINDYGQWPDFAIDVLVGGTPCQSFSVAGLRGGMDDPRGQLTRRFLDVAGRYAPDWIVWENVPGVLSADGGRAFAAFLAGLAKLGYGFAYRILDAQYFGLAQRRERVFVVGCAGGKWQRAAAVLFDSAGLRWNPAPSREPGQRVATTIGNRAKGGGGLGTDAECDGALVTTHTFTSEGHDASEDGTGRGVPIVAMAANSRSNRYDAESQTLIPHGGVRRLTPTEVERLFGFPDDYTAIPWRGKPATQCPDSPRYRALGNSMAVPVMRWIGKRMEALGKLREALR